MSVVKLDKQIKHSTNEIKNSVLSRYDRLLVIKDCLISDLEQLQI